MSEHIVHVTDASFDEEVLKSRLPVLVDYWAEWCGPCKMIAPVLDEIARDYAGRLKVCKMDVDANGETPARYAIRDQWQVRIAEDGLPEFTPPARQDPHRRPLRHRRHAPPDAA